VGAVRLWRRQVERASVPPKVVEESRFLEVPGA
jgi:hypothetical protein